MVYYGCREMMLKIKSEENMLENFIKVADMPQEVIEKYKDQVPAELLQIWQEDGLGTFLDGYLKVINPDDYLELLQDSYFRGDIAFPMFVTAFGDIITWEENEFVRTFHIENKQKCWNIADFREILLGIFNVRI